MHFAVQTLHCAAPMQSCSLAGQISSNSSRRALVSGQSRFATDNFLRRPTKSARVDDQAGRKVRKVRKPRKLRNNCDSEKNKQTSSLAAALSPTAVECRFVPLASYANWLASDDRPHEPSTLANIRPVDSLRQVDSTDVNGELVFRAASCIFFPSFSASLNAIIPPHWLAQPRAKIGPPARPSGGPNWRPVARLRARKRQTRCTGRRGARVRPSVCALISLVGKANEELAGDCLAASCNICAPEESVSEIADCLASVCRMERRDSCLGATLLCILLAASGCDRPAKQRPPPTSRLPRRPNCNSLAEEQTRRRTKGARPPPEAELSPPLCGISLAGVHSH